MNSFGFYGPTYFVFGRDREQETGKSVKRFGGSRVLVVYGGQSAKRSGLLDRVHASLAAEGLVTMELGGEKRLAQMAVRVFGCQMDFDDPKRTAMEGIEAFKTFLKSIGMPLTFAEIGADPADIPKLVEMNHIGDGVTGGYVGLNREAHFKIYEYEAGLN